MRFQTDDDFHFDYFLAEKLHLTIGQVHAMPQEEWLNWAMYFTRKSQARDLEMRRSK
jgi:hypothetical protein